jgi:hypothetical protein
MALSASKVTALAWEPDPEHRDFAAGVAPGGQYLCRKGGNDVRLLEALGVLCREVLDRLQAPHSVARPFERRLDDTTVFCELCSDWHPPGNCAGEWP